MLYKIAEFKVKKDQVEEAKKLIREFVIKVGSEARTLQYETYLKNDDQSFIHFMTFDSPDAEEYHLNTDYCKLFTSKLYPMCEIEPVFTMITKF